MFNHNLIDLINSIRKFYNNMHLNPENFNLA